MADRAFHRGHQSLELSVVHLYARFAVGATGAPTLTAASSQGISEVVRDSAGQYTITLSDQYAGGLLWADVQLLTVADSSALTVGIGSRVEVDETDSADKYVQIQFYALDDGAVADPADGDVVLVKLELKNSTV